jgi:hypothetical protein
LMASMRASPMARLQRFPKSQQRFSRDCLSGMVYMANCADFGIIAVESAMAATGFGGCAGTGRYIK